MGSAEGGHASRHDADQDSLNSLADRPDILDESTFVPASAAIVNNADEGIAYLVMAPSERQDVRQAIQSLAQEIAARMGLVMLPRYRR